MWDEQCIFCVISGLRRELDENCAFLGYHTANSDNILLTFRDNFSVLSSGVKNPLFKFLDP